MSDLRHVIGLGACVFVAGSLGMALVHELRRRHAARGRGARSTKTTTAAEAWRPEETAPIEVPIIDVGAPPHRVVDLRRVSWDVLAMRAFTEGLERLFAARAAPVSVVWVFGSSVTKVLPALTDAVHVIVWRRYVALAPQAAHAWHVHEAPPAGALGTFGAIEATGMRVAVEAPSFLTTKDGASRVVTLDDALASSSAAS